MPLTTLSGIKDALSEDFDLSAYKVLNPDDNFREIIDWSSMNALIMAAQLKKIYQVDILPGELRSLNTFGDLVLHINSKLTLVK